MNPNTVLTPALAPVRRPSNSWWRRRGIRALVLLAAAGASLAIDRGVIGVVPLLFLLVVPFEKLFPRHRGQKVRRPELRTDLAWAFLSPVLGAFGVAAAIVIGGFSLFWIPGLFARPLVAAIPAAALPLVGFALFDFLAYWTHRWAHEVPIMWRFHAVHHSTRTLDWVSGFRAHPFDGILVAPAFFFFLAAGFGAELTGIFAVAQILSGLFLHANVRWRLRRLDRVVANPEFHHWHHANEADAWCTNYAAFLPIWDVMFGTFHMPSDRRPQVYGVSEPMPRDFLGQVLHPLRGARRYVRLIVHPIRLARAVGRGALGLVKELRRSTFRRGPSTESGI